MKNLLKNLQQLAKETKLIDEQAKALNKKVSKQNKK